MVYASVKPRLLSRLFWKKPGGKDPGYEDSLHWMLRVPVRVWAFSNRDTTQTQSKDEQTVGHMPREHSRLSWYFLKHGGQIICEVTGRRKRSSTPGKGLEVPCLYTFKDKPALIKRLIKVLVVKK